MQRRILDEKRTNEANYLFINSESKRVSGANNNFSFDLSDFPVIKNKSYNLYIKSVYYPTTIHQITELYQYNQLRIRVLNTNTTISTFSTITIAEGTYNTSQYAQAVSLALNTFLASFGYDQYDMGYDDIRNRFYFERKTTVTPAIRVYITSNDSFSQYNDEFGFGGSYVIGCNYNTEYELPIQTTPKKYLPNPGNLQPYSYFFMTIQGITNLNYNTDVPERFDIAYRCPLNLSNSKYQYTFVEEASEEFTQQVFSVLPTRFNISFIDQYNNLVNFPQTASVDITLKLVPVE